MARLALRLLGLGLLAVAIGVPGCQALFPRDAADTPNAPHIVRDGQGP
jgi:hypothetical protein